MKSMRSFLLMGGVVLLGMVPSLLGMEPPLHSQFLVVTNLDNSLTIVGYEGSDASLVIPSAIDDAPVAAIGAQAFQFMASPTNAAIPDSVHTIQYQAFSGCSNLRSVSLGAGVSAIERPKPLKTAT